MAYDGEGREGGGRDGGGRDGGGRDGGGGRDRRDSRERERSVSRGRDRRDSRERVDDRGGARGRSPDRRGGGGDEYERKRSRSRSGGRDGDDKEKLSSDHMNLEAGAVAYLLGRNGATKQRLANFSGARLEIDPRGEGGGRIEIIGTHEERRLARMCIDITLQQRNNGQVIVDLDALEARNDVQILDVPQGAVGFVLGSRGATLREFETKYRTFMFFDNENIRNGNKKRLYILGLPDARKRALAECENAVAYKMSGNGSLSSWRERDGGPGPRYDRGYRRSRSRSRSRDRGRGGGGYDDRDRGGGGYGGRDDRRSRSPPRHYEERRRDDRRSRSRSPPRRYDDRRGGYDDRGGRGGYDDRR